MMEKETNYFARLNPENGELADSELETVAGGCGGDNPVRVDGLKKRHF